jgi:hypothetical protein
MPRRHLLILIVCFVAFILCVVLLFVAAGIHKSLEAEKTLHAYDIVIQVVEQSVLQHGGQWPRSWQELETIHQIEPSAGWKWPDDRAEIAKRVQVDFTLSSEQVVKMSPTSFSAIVQFGPSFPPQEFRIAALIETVRKSLAESPRPEGAQLK